MTDNQIIEETLRYLSDKSYNYAILIDGEWGCGKTFFIQHALKEKIEESEQETGYQRKIKYISLYGCKSVQDIQENIIWGFAEEAKANLGNRTETNGHAIKISDNILLSSRKIGNAILKKFAPEANAYEIASDWLAMQSYIFVFDDIERCDCPLNEVFGFINGLVEHEGTKVILVANEKEISMNEILSQRELQYSLALSDKISWPVNDGDFTHIRPKEDNVTLEELEERRRILFPDEEVNAEYRKIREKLIGVTLHYQPDINSIMKAIIENSDMELLLKETLLDDVNNFYAIMDYYNHYNLRTFQFFLSKVSYLYRKFNAIVIEEKYKEQLLYFLVEDCFRWSVQFKGNISIPTDCWGRATYEARMKSVAIKMYVEVGEFKEDIFKEDLSKYLENELKNKLPDNDPFKLLYQQYYYHTQKWCEERLEEIKQKLQCGNYPLSAYKKLIIFMDDLIELGFSASYMTDLKNLMIKNITKMNTPVILDNDVSYIQNTERRWEIRNIINELNLVIIAQDKQMKQKTIREILSGERWVKELSKYTAPENYHLFMDSSVFAKADAEQWIKVIMEAAVEDIDLFRNWLSGLFPANVIRESAQIDMPVLKEVMNGIKPEEEKDLIKKANLSWVKEQIKRILELYKAT